MSIAPVPNAALPKKVELEIDPRIAEQLKQRTDQAIAAAQDALTKPAQEVAAACYPDAPRASINAAVENACDGSAQVIKEVSHKAIDASCGPDGACINVLRWAVEKFTRPQQQ